MTSSIDLHGVKHQDAEQIIHENIWRCMSNHIPRLYVITGHSQEMKKIVINAVALYNITVVESMFNPAEMIIDL
jgi:DNA-nicking Smr family endonuclease